MNKKIKEFIKGQNAVEIRSKSEFQDFVNLLKRDGVIDSVFVDCNDLDYDYWVDIVCLNAKQGSSMCGSKSQFHLFLIQSHF